MDRDEANIGARFLTQEKAGRGYDPEDMSDIGQFE